MYVCFHSNVLLLKVRRNISNTLLPAEIYRNVDYFLNMKHVEHCRTIRLPWLSLMASVRCEGFSRDIPPNRGFWWYPVSCSDRTNWPHGALTVNMFVGFAGPIGPIGYIGISVYSSNEHNLGKKPVHRPVQALQLGSELHSMPWPFQPELISWYCLAMLSQPQRTSLVMAIEYPPVQF